MLKIDGKTFMNIQEAVQWLLDNNALPFQSSANYVANTEIGMGTIVNPSPAKVRIGSLIFFADSKVSTVIGLTENGFIVSDQYNDLVDDVVYVSNVELNASGHLIVTLSNGDTIDAGLVKQVSGFSIDGSQHLIASYNDGSSTDLGAIFSGNVNISGNLTANSIIETMAGYTYTKFSETTNLTREFIYAGVVKNGNKLTLALAINLTRTGDIAGNSAVLGFFAVPTSVANKLYPVNIGGYDYLSCQKLQAWEGENTPQDVYTNIQKAGDSLILYANHLDNLTLNTKSYLRVEVTFLLSENLVS